MAAVEVSRNRLMDFKISSEEVNQLKEALKDEKFRNLLIEYSKEMNDPKNRELYESELAEYEREQGSEVIFIEPSGNYVIKTWNLCGGKIMINICSSPRVAEPVCQVVNDISKSGQEWSIPYMIGSYRQEIDRRKNMCDVVDVIFHDRTIHLLKTSPAFKKLVNNTALDAVEGRLNAHIDKENVKFPKLKYKGAIQKCILRTDVSKKVAPSYEIVYRENSFGVKTTLVVKIRLPALSSTEDCSLDVTDFVLVLDQKIYGLKLELPMKVNSDKGKATFDTATKSLIVDLPLYQSDDDSIPLANNAHNNQLFAAQQLQNKTDEVDNITAQCQELMIQEEEEETHSNTENEEKLEPKVDDNEQIKSVQVKRKAEECTADGPNNNYWSQNYGGSKVIAANNINKRLHLKPALKTRSFSESSDDWCMSHSPSKSILKRSFSISSSEMSQSFELAEEHEGAVNMQQLASSVNNGSSSIKKSVSFSDVISKQLFRPDSSILGQRKKNQRRARNKRKTQGKHTNSESEGDACSENETPGPSSTASKPTEFTSDLMFDLDM